MATKKPVIGITLDWQEEGTFSKRPHYALRQHYFDVIAKAGGIPVGLAYLENTTEDYLSIIDGLLVPGGFFASPPDWYEEAGSTSPYEASPRLAFDLELIEKALEKDIPLLGICAGMQLLGGLFGCKMTPDLHRHYNTRIDHINGAPAEQYCHDITIEKDSFLYKLLGKTTIAVNSAHREAIIKTSSPLTISAKAEDGVIEAIEIPEKRFAVGVQWHPEFFMEDEEPSYELIKQFVKHAAQ